MKTVHVNGAIGGWFGISASEIVNEIKNIPKSEDLLVVINSPGGSVFDGLSIYHAIRDFEGKKTTRVNGLAASMGSVIAMAGDEVEVSEGSMIMIHNPWSASVGDAEALRKEAGILDKIRDSLVSIYARVTGKSSEELVKMMDDETWFTADEAVENGIAGKKVLGFDANAGMDYKFAASLKGFTKAPEAAKKYFKLDPQQAAKPEAIDPAALALKASTDERNRIRGLQELAFDGFAVDGFIDSGASVADAKLAAFDVLKQKVSAQAEEISSLKKNVPSIPGVLQMLDAAAATVPADQPPTETKSVLDIYRSLKGAEKTVYFQKNEAAIRAATANQKQTNKDGK